MVPNITQKHPPRPPESNKNTRTLPEAQQKTNFGAGPSSCTPKGSQIRPPTRTKTSQNQEFIRYAKKHEFSLLVTGLKINFWDPTCGSFGYISEDVHHRESNFDFRRMYHTDYMFLQSKPFEFRYEKQSEGAHFHMLHKPSVEDSKKRPKKSPKDTPKPSSGPFGSTQRRPLKLDTSKSHFCRREPPGGFAVFEPWALEMAPQLYIYIYIYI